MADFSGPDMVLTKLGDVGKNPFDAVLTDDAHTYLVGLFGEKGVTAIDLWADDPAPVRFLKDYGKTEEDLPVYKMPHLQGWAFTEGQYVAARRRPARAAVGRPRHACTRSRAPRCTASRCSSSRSRPRPIVWVNFATPLNDTVQVVDSRSHEVVTTLTPGKARPAHGIRAARRRGLDVGAR